MVVAVVVDTVALDVAVEVVEVGIADGKATASVVG